MRRAAGLLLASLALALAVGCDDHDVVFVFRSGADLNVDGFADVVIGAPLHDGGGAPGSRRGAVFVHFGGPAGPSPTPRLPLFGSEDGAEFGSAVSFAGDVNRGGAPDLLVGAPFDDGDGNTSDDGVDRGRSVVFRGGGADLDALPDYTIDGPQDGGLAGTAIAK